MVEHAVPAQSNFDVVRFFARVELGDGARFGVRGAANDEDDDLSRFLRALRGETVPGGRIFGSWEFAVRALGDQRAHERDVSSVHVLGAF